MHSAVLDMLQPYDCQTPDDYRNALKEIIQEIALLGLFRGGFFDKAAFYGGTALRIFYGLNRFSEDLDFSLTAPDPDFDLAAFFPFLLDELASFGFEVDVSQKQKNNSTAIESAFIKGNTAFHLLKIDASKLSLGIHRDELLRVKLEVDTDPPASAEFKVQYHLKPIPFSVRLFTPECLFAGKLHALLCRQWKTRVKGRDFYDYIWYLQKEIPVHLGHLEQRMRQTGHWQGDEILTREQLFDLLQEKFSKMDFDQAARDVLPFIEDQREVEVWSVDFFKAVTAQLQVI